MDKELIERTLKMAKEQLKEEGIELKEDELRDRVIKSLEKKENTVIEKILEALKETIEQPLSNKKHWKKRAASGMNDRGVVFEKCHGWQSRIRGAKGNSTLRLYFATNDGIDSIRSWILDSKFSVFEPWKAAARWLGVDIPPPLHEILGVDPEKFGLEPGSYDIFS